MSKRTFLPAGGSGDQVHIAMNLPAQSSNTGKYLKKARGRRFSAIPIHNRGAVALRRSAQPQV